MNNVYEITITKEVMKTEYFTEIVELNEISNQTRETLDSFIKEKYGEGEEGVKINSASVPTKKEPLKYFVGNIKYEPSILEENAEIYWGRSEDWEREPLLDVKITFPENTKSVIAYDSHSHSIKTLLPCDSLLFYFSIEKEKVVDLWERGNIKELKKYNIIPTELKHRNLVDAIGGFVYTTVHPNHSVLLDGIYKKKKNKKMRFIAVFTCDEWNKTDLYQFRHYGNSQLTPIPTHHLDRDSRSYDHDTNEFIRYEHMKDENGEVKNFRVGTYKSTIDEKGKLYRYAHKDEPIMNYDNDKLKTYFEERNAREREEDERGGV